MRVTETALPVCIDIASIAPLHRDLAACIAERRATALSAAAVRRVDTAGLQLLVAFLADARRCRVAARLTDPSATLVEAARRAGLCGALGIETPGVSS